MATPCQVPGARLARGRFPRWRSSDLAYVNVSWPPLVHHAGGKSGLRRKSRALWPDATRRADLPGTVVNPVQQRRERGACRTLYANVP